MQMRTRRGAGGSDIADDVALADPLAGAHTRSIAQHVRIGGLVIVGVLDADIIAIAAIAAGALDRAIARCIDWRAGRCGEISALVQARIARDRMAPIAEGG